MKRILSWILIVEIFCCSVWAADPDDLRTALRAAFNGVLSVVASSVSESPVPLQGVNVEHGSGVLPFYVTFTRSDLSSYLETLSFYQSDSPSWYRTLFGSQSDSAFPPFRESALEHLRAAGYRKGEVVLDGSVRVRDAEDVSLSDLASGTDWSGAYFPVEISILVSGTRMKQMLVLEGKIDITGLSSSTLRIESDDLSVNGEKMELDPVTIRY